MRRLYVGGLSHSVTQKDLKDRFGKFGDVEDVELRTRRDDEGVPFKTFSYININISDADLKKCMTVLNKSKWKGGTLQIEAAKESFLHKLAEERQTAAEQRLQPPAAEDSRQKMLDSLSNAGVDNFTMKAAVPGTEVPGHKDWVVSKFGRVLPVLQLRSQKGSKARTLKYDPSKYSHNIRRLDRSAAADQEEVTPVSQLTWEVPGGDDDISKKRRGEFPPFEPARRKKSRTDSVKASSKQTPDSVLHAEAHRFTNGSKAATNQHPAQRKQQPVKQHFTGSDVDSDEEIRRMVAAQNSSHDALRQEEEEDLEVVGLDYLVKSGRLQKGGPGDKEEDDYDSADTDELFASRKAPPPPPPATEQLSENGVGAKKKTKKKSKAVEEESDSSGDEEEHSSMQKRGDSGSQMKVLPVLKAPCSESDEEEEDDDDGNDDDKEEEGDDEDEEDGDSDYEAMFSNVVRLEISLADLQKLSEESQETSETTTPSMPLPAFQGTRALNEGALTEERKRSEKEDKGGKEKLNTRATQLNHSKKSSESSEEEEEEEEKKEETGSSSSEEEEDDEEESDSDYDAMFSNVTCLEISLADLQRLAEASSETTTPSIPGTSSEVERPAPKKGTTPEEILAAIMEDDSSEDEKKKKRKRKAVATTPLPAFQGTRALDEEVQTERKRREKEEEEGGRSEVKRQKLNHDKKSSESSEEEEEEEKKDEVVKNVAETHSSTSSEEEEEEEDEEEEEEKKDEVVKKVAETASSSSSEEEEEEMQTNQTVPTAASSSSSSSDEEEEEEKQAPPPPPRVPLGAKEEEDRQRKANLRRLAAVQQRQREAEEHKKLIQGALANLDAPAAGAGKHIVFGSDDDDDDDDDEKQTTPEVTRSKKTLFNDDQSEDEDKEKMRLKPSGPQLFGGSEEEEDGDEEEDSSRFDIRPQFEGPAGQKLMELQSRFGTDERFRMDSRFLEEDQDKEAESEKKSGTEEEEALEEERKKNLSILQSVLGSSVQTSSSKSAAKAKTFRDVSALHYDPSREEHAAFETKPEEVKKESKSARKKKREEAQKLPEVSKEIYYDVSGDLKAAFGQTKEDTAEEDENTNWDQEEEKEEEEEDRKDEDLTLQSSLPSADPSAETEDASGFKFSFFGDDEGAGGGGETEYKVESIQAPKVSWQQDLRFHDSSSDEEEEQEKEEEQSDVAAETTKEETPSKADLLFFFHAGDSRLTEGPGFFCRSSQLEEQREQWEERRSELRQEYRKKHKDARRKLKSSLKS